MITIREVIGKNINKLVTKDKFIDKPLEQYLYASLSQPPIRILDKKGSLDELNYIVECPNCHRAVCYGTDIFMIGGYLYCSNDSCREEVIARYNNRYNKK